MIVQGRENLIIYVMGVSGSGKTTIGQMLSTRTGIPFFDADDYHSKTNKDKMAAGHPLTDEDRQGWLVAINRLATQELDVKGAIIACSALKSVYRDLLGSSLHDSVKWVMLDGNFNQIKERMQKRKGHFMPDMLLNSQFEILEKPKNALQIDIANAPGEIVEKIMTELHLS